jgi:general stress protein CsbA
MYQVWLILIVLYVAFKKNITFGQIEMRRYQKMTLWGFSMILIIIAKLNAEKLNNLFLIGISVVSLIPLFIRDKYASDS